MIRTSLTSAAPPFEKMLAQQFRKHAPIRESAERHNGSITIPYDARCDVWE